MSNPYQPTSFDPTHFQDQTAAGPAATYGSSNWVGQVRTFAILNMAQGVFEAVVGLGLSGLGIMFPMMANMQEVKEMPAQDGVSPEQMFWVIGAFYLVVGASILAIGILRIIAGVQSYRFRSRTLSLVSLFLGIVVVFTGICAPTAIALLIFGLIIYLDPAVKAAFDLVKQGRTVSQVLAMFNPHQAAHPGPPQQPVSSGPPPA